MAQYSSENILVGAAAIFTASEKDADIPSAIADAENAAAAAADFVADTTNWTSTGYTTGGVEVTYTPDFGEVEVDQLLDAAVMFKQRMTVAVGTTLAEATLENLILAWGQKDDSMTGFGDTTATRTLTMESGKLGDRPVERQLAFIGQAPYNESAETFRLYHLFRCLNVESSSHSLSRSDATTIPVSLRCLPDNNGEYGYITDYVAGTVPAAEDSSSA